MKILALKVSWLVSLLEKAKHHLRNGLNQEVSHDKQRAAVSE